MQGVDQRQRGMIADNKRNTARNINMSVKNKKLMINNAPYKKQAPAPRMCDMLTISDDKRESIQTAELASTTEYKEKGNRFFFYAIETCNIQEVRAVHKHLRIKHLDATHVAVAYNLASVSPEFQDYDDNGETGAGSRMLKKLQDMDKPNTAVYLGRYRSGQNLGKRRFEIIEQQTELAVKSLEDPLQMKMSTVPKQRKRIVTPKHRTRGKVLGARGATHAARPASRVNIAMAGIDNRQSKPVSNRRSTLSSMMANILPTNNRFGALMSNSQEEYSTNLDTESDPEVVLQYRSAMEANN